MAETSKKVLKITTEYITLGQFLKFSDVISSGAEAKDFILEHNILVNDVECKMRGKKLRNKDHIKIDDSLIFEIVNEN